MKGLQHIALFAGLFFIAFAKAQNLENKTLFTVDGKEFKAGGFMRSYLKNLDDVQDDEQKDIDNYLDLYIDYRIKLLQAYENDLDERESYQKEVADWRNVLAEKYLTDVEVTESLVRQAYDRKVNEVNASHILVKLGRGASPQDTLQAYEKMMDIRKKVVEGMDFAEAAKAYSEGPSGKEGGDLGWFSVFRMVYPFENAAYNTEVGKVSDIFRTDFGYHILKVNDKREARGTATVAHIMTYDGPNDTIQDAEERINNAYAKLKAGEKFAVLAKRYSDDVRSSSQGGKIPPFSTGGVNSEEFEDRAFALNVGEYTEPFKTKYGWHIVKLIEYDSIGSYRELKNQLSKRIQRSPRARRITESFTNMLKEKYDVNIQESQKVAAREAVTDSVLVGTYEVPADSMKFKKKTVLTIQEEDYSLLDYLKFVENWQMKYRKSFDDKNKKAAFLYDEFVINRLRQYYDEHLERDNEEFANLYTEYREGLLLFELMQYMTEEKAKQDTTRLRKYYNEHKDKYRWNKRVDVEIVTIWNDSLTEEVHQLLKGGISVDSVKNRYKNDTRAQLMVSKGKLEVGHRRLPDGLQVREGVSEIYMKDKRPVIVNIKEVLPPSQKSFSEALPLVINHYQQVLDKQWKENLRDGREINVRSRILRKVKRQLADEI